MRFLLTLALGLIFALGAQAQTTTRAIAGKRYTVGIMALELNGIAQGPVRSIAGGAVYGEVVAEKGGTSRSPGKRIGAVRYEPITLEVGLDMVPQFWEMIRQWPATSKRLSGAIVFGDINLKQIKRLEFTSALITEIELPPLDAATGKQPFGLFVTLQPDRIENRSGSGGMINAQGSKGRQALSSNFRLTGGGLDLSRVTKVDGFAIKQQASTGNIGELRRLAVEPGMVEYGDLVLTLAETNMASVESLFQDSVVKGSGRELDIKLELMDPTLKTVLATINLRGVGIWKIGGSEQEANAQRVAMTQAHFYVEGATIDIK